MNSGLYDNATIVDISEIQSFIEGKVLNFEFEGKQRKFIREHISSQGGNSFYWLGYDEFGKRFSLLKDDQGYSGVFENYTILPYYGARVFILQNKPALTKGECITLEEPKNEDILTEFRNNPSRLIRVLFLFTNAANLAGNPTATANNVVNQLNASIVPSGLSPADICFVSSGVEQLPGFIESNNISNDRDDLISDQTANNLRDDHFADVVVLLTNGLNYDAAGIACIAASNSNAYMIAQIGAAMANFTASHEMGHTFGARHQRCFLCSTSIIDGCDEIGAFHGTLIGPETGVNSRTIMCQNNCNDRIRVGRWSDISATFNGESTGNFLNWNTRVLKLRARFVTNYRGEPSTPNPIVNISGPNFVACANSYAWTASFNPNDFNGSPSFLWEKSNTGTGGWTYEGNQSSLTYLNNELPDNPFVLRLTMSDGTGANGVATLSVDVAFCNEDEDNLATVVRNDFGFSVYPNPFSSEVVIKYNNTEDGIMTLHNSQGKLLNQFFIQEGRQEIILGSTLPSGVYILSDSFGNTKKILKQ